MDDDENVPGSIVWHDPSSKPAVGAPAQGWTFIPENAVVYEVVTGVSPITVNKATPSGTPTITRITQAGKTLADTALTGSFTNPYDASEVSGTLAWDSEDSTAVAANTAYGWTFMPDDDANYYSRAGSFTPYSRSSGGSGGSGGGTTSPATPTPPTSPNVGADGAVSQSTITGEAATALGAATGTTATVRTQGASQINPTTLDALAGAGAQAGRQVVLHADTMTGSAVQGRLYVEPAKLTGRTEPLKLGVYTEPARTATTTGLFERFFDNNIATISLEQQGSFGASLQIAARVDLSTLDITALVFYSYAQTPPSFGANSGRAAKSRLAGHVWRAVRRQGRRGFYRCRPQIRQGKYPCAR